MTKPTRVRIGVDRLTDELKEAVVVDEIVAEFFVPEGAELDLEPFIVEGVRSQGWKVVRRPGAHVVPEVDGDVAGPNWAKIAEDMAQAVRSGDVQAALDLHETAALQQAMFEAGDGEHEHEWPADLDADAQCTVAGCNLRYGDWSEHP